MSVIREIRDILRRLSSVEREISKLPSRISVGSGGGGSANKQYVFCHTAATKAALPDPTDDVVAIGDKARTDDGWEYIISPDGLFWHATNACE